MSLTRENTTKAPNGDALEPSPRFQVTPSGSRLIVAVVACACCIVVLTSPQAALPIEMPALSVPSEAFEFTMARDSELAMAAPTGPVADRLRSLLAAQGDAEAGALESTEETQERHRALRRLRSLMEQEEGSPEARRAALRGQLALRLWPALRGELDAAEERAVLGSFPRMLQRYSAARGGRVVAPHLAVHAMYKARFNRLVGVSPTDGFTDAEVRAFWGWAATSAPDATSELVQEAVQAYAAAGGDNAREVAAISAVRNGRAALASRMFSRIYDERGLLRYRNYALGALLVAGLQ